MPDKTREVAPGPEPRSVRTTTGQTLQVPATWELVPPGDPGLTRRVKAAGPTWTVKERRGRRMFSQGVWAHGENVIRIRAELAQERSDPSYARKLEAGRKRREAKQVQYEAELLGAIRTFLGFAPSYEDLERAVASAITEHTAAVGSGTVARTQRISVERRAEAATIAWLRHQTTEYDDMTIPRVKGMRREVRRMLAERSRCLLQRYRNGEPIAPQDCPLHHALLPF